MPKDLMQLLTTTLTLSVIGWVFFRAATFADAWSILLAMADWHNVVLGSLGSFSLKKFAVVCLLFAMMPFVYNPLKIMKWFKPNWQWLIILLALSIASLYKFSQVSDFLYFQF